MGCGGSREENFVDLGETLNEDDCLHTAVSIPCQCAAVQWRKRAADGRQGPGMGACGNSVAPLRYSSQRSCGTLLSAQLMTRCALVGCKDE